MSGAKRDDSDRRRNRSGLRLSDRLTAEQDEPHRRVVRCAVKGCRRATKDRKPYCPRHVLRMPYAALVSHLFWVEGVR